MIEVVALFAFAGSVGLAGGFLGVWCLKRQGEVKVPRGKAHRVPVKRRAG